jgi:SOS-response transcriptional repressor LexA
MGYYGSTHSAKRRLNSFQEVIKEFWLEHGYGPDARDIMARLNISSSSVVYYNLKRMQKMGEVLWDRNKARSIRLPNMRITFDQDKDGDE